MAKAVRKRRSRISPGDQPKDYGKRDPNHPSILKGRIWECSEYACRDKGPFTLQGIKYHNTLMHNRSWGSTFRNDGYPMPETIEVRGVNVLSDQPQSQEICKKTRRNVEQPVAPATTINYCPCCGTSLQAFQAAADITANG